MDPLTPDHSSAESRGEMTLGRTGLIFGGQIAAHLMSTAGRVVDIETYRPNSIHVSFLTAGDGRQPVIYRPRILKTGRAFWVMGVDAVQGEQTIATSIVSFHRTEVSAEHGESLTGVPAVEDCRPLDLDEIGGPSPVWDPLEARVIAVEPHAVEPAMRMWMRWRDHLGADPVRQAAALCWISDMVMVRTMALRETWPPRERAAASLDHTVWFHRALACDEWFSISVTSPVRAGARSLAHARCHRADGTFTSSVAQEGLIR